MTRDVDTTGPTIAPALNVVLDAVCGAPAPPSLMVDHAAKRLGICRRSVYYWIASGHLQTIRSKNGKSSRVLVSSIDDVLAGRAPRPVRRGIRKVAA